jgi:CubicO group peptidase (beta-lactamase class C family)
MRERVLAPLGMHDTAFYAKDTKRLATAYGNLGELTVTDPPEGQWARPPRFPDGSGGLVSTVDDVAAFGRMLLAGGGPVLSPATVAQMTTDRLTPQQRDNVWPGFSFLDDGGWGYGVAVGADGRYGWDGGGGTTWKNVPDQDLTVVVLTQCEAGETGLPAICRDLVAALVSGR